LSFAVPEPRQTLPARARALVVILVAATLGLTAPSASAAPTPLPSSASPIDAERVKRADARALDAALDRARRGIGAGLSVAVVTNDGRSWTEASGFDRLGRRMSEDDAIAIGSVTKTFTAALILALVDEGRIDLDAPVRRYLPKVRLVRGVTVRQLLNHTSGIADLYRPLKEHLAHRRHAALSSNDVLFSVGRRWFRAGEGHAYSNTNYFLLGHVIESVTHRSFAKELERRFTGPMGLTHTRLLTAEDSLLPAAWSSGFWTSGAMKSTPLELAVWGQELYRGRVVSYASTRSMLNFNAGYRYGLGAQRFEIAGRNLPGHSGLLYTSTTLLVHLPQEKITVALSTPSTNVDLEFALAGRHGGRSLLAAVLELAR
jgi:D-alanyl-D-alanine carboxypeptidase